MPYSVRIVVFLLLLSLSLGEYDHVIFVDNQEGNNTANCLLSNRRSISCFELNWVLQQPLARRNSTHLVLSEGSHMLWESVAPFEDLFSVVISGSNSVITCKRGVGMAFSNVRNISLLNITFTKCASFRHWSTYGNASRGILVGVFFNMCSNILMDHVDVTHSPNATGVVMVYTTGINTFTGCQFSHNSATFGGGGLLLWNQCLSKEICNGFELLGTKYRITSCVFDSNAARGFGYEQGHEFPVSNLYQLGLGGGIAMVTGGNVSNTRLTIDGSVFTNNSAIAAGALYVELNHGQGNIISITNTRFQGNYSPQLLDIESSGGAIYVVKGAHFNYTPLVRKFIQNQWTMYNCSLESNRAFKGGAMAISWPLEITTSNVTNFNLSQVFFRNNTAKFGAAVHIEHIWKNSRNEGIMAKVRITNCRFAHNTDHGIYTDRNKPVEAGIGTLSVFSSVVYFYGNNNFTNNHGTALVLSNSDAIFDIGYSRFSRNTGLHGGALALIDSSTLNLASGARLMFDSNMAITRGGAIYASFLSRLHLYCAKCCFVRHFKSGLHPDDWNVSVTFVNNTDSGGISPNAIYATTLLPCTYMGSINQTFCWRGWHYYNSTISSQLVDCQRFINTDIGNLEYKNTSQENYKAVPGWKFQLPVIAVNNYNRDVTNSTMFLLRDNYSHAISYSLGDLTSIGLPEEISVDIIVETIDQRIWNLQFLVEMQKCPPGFGMHQSKYSSTCRCSNDYRGILYCDDKVQRATILNGFWMGNYSDRYYVTRCPNGFCAKQGKKSVVLPTSPADLNDLVCAKNREGIICGECKDGYGPAADYPLSDCIQCNQTNLAVDIFMHFASLYIPLLVFFIILIVFDIRLTTGPANAFIFYSQAVSTIFGITADGAIPLGQFTGNRTESLELSFRIPYGIFNLRFIERYIHFICYSESMNALDGVLLDYGIAFFPIVIIFGTILLLKVKDLCDGRWRIPSKYQRRLDRVRHSLLPAFATFVLLSYSRVNNISTTLMSTTPLVAENGSNIYPSRLTYAGQYSTKDRGFYFYFIPGVLVFSAFVVTVPLFLLDFPLRFVEYLTNRSPLLAKFYPSVKIYILVDTFQGCYRKNARFFAGLYFLLRLALNLSHLYFDTWLGQYIFQQILMTACIVLVALVQPYKRRFINYIDILIFTDLAIINALSLFFRVYFNAASQVETISSGLFVIFVIQYTLVFLPLLGMIMFIILRWKLSRYVILTCLRRLAGLCCPTTSPTYQALHALT